MAMRLLFFAPVLVFFSVASRAQDVSIDRADIVEAGLYSVQPTGETIQNQNTAAGVVRTATGPKLLKRTTTVPGKTGVFFGVRFIVRGKPQGAKTNITYVTKYPPQGLRNPDTGKTSYEGRYEWPVEIGMNEARVYGFESAWEAQPGEWALEFWYQGKKLGGQTFTVVTP
jgi:Domain of unknown function (DUF3859)